MSTTSRLVLKRIVWTANPKKSEGIVFAGQTLNSLGGTTKPSITILKGDNFCPLFL